MSEAFTVNFQTLGCRLNQSETEGAARFFSDSGFISDFSPLTADSDFSKFFLFVINTCSVTTKAEQKARRLIRLILSKNPMCAVLVTGCYAELSRKELCAIDSRVCVLEGKRKSLVSKLPGKLMNQLEVEKADGEKIASFIQNFFDTTVIIRKDAGSSSSVLKTAAISPFELVTPNFLHHSRPALKIQDGCNFACTYCTIHIARGKSVSLDVDEVLKRVRELENEGYGEVVFTTVNISNYSSVFKTEDGTEEVYDFKDLLKYLLKNTERIKFRISSLYPQIVDEDFCRVIKNKRICPYFHISVQSGSDAILRAMARPYKAEAVIRAAKLLKIAKENPFLACDIITGFPGETEADFEETLKLCREVGFQQIHAFPYSPRPGTPAAVMKPKVSNDLAGKRVAELEKISNENISSYVKLYEDRELEAICETVHGKKSSDSDGKILIHAVTENFLHCVVEIKNDEEIPESGSVIKVKIKGEIMHSKNEWKVLAVLV